MQIKLQPSLSRVTFALGIIVTLVAAAIHFVFALTAGALWRDEVNSFNIATMPSLAELWHNLAFDSFPGLFFILLRALSIFSPAMSDHGLRIFGAIVGLFSLLIIWWNARAFATGAPLIALALVGLNPMIVRFGDSIRAYGLGAILALATLGAFWRLLESFTPRRGIVAGLIALVSVQCLYYNAFLLLANCLGALLVTWCLRRNLKQTVSILGIGFACAMSLVVYLPTIHQVEDTSFFWRVPFTAQLFVLKLREVIGSPQQWVTLVWILILAAAVAMTAIVLSDRTADERLRERLVFVFASLVIGSVLYAAFLFHLSYLTQPWYYIVVAAFSAMCLDLLFQFPGRFALMSIVRAVTAIVFVGSIAYPTCEAVQMRQTNVDRIAAKLQSVSQAGDVIVFNTWNFGIPFQRYYHGDARQIAVPPMNDLRTHRMDLVKRQILNPQATRALVDSVDQSLREGHTVWLIGSYSPLPPGRQPAPFPEIPPGFKHFHNWEQYRAWSERLGAALQSRATTLAQIPIRSEVPVSHYENLDLFAFHGYRSSP